MSEIIKVGNVRKVYGDGKYEKQYTALKNISFSVQEGEFVGIMGSSGSGKTTLLNILSTLDKPTAGDVIVDGINITELKNNDLSDFRANEIGFIFQDFNLLDNMTSYENIALPLSLANEKSSQIDVKVKNIAKKLNLEDVLDKFPSELSGGQKQRVASARALIHNPAVLYGDEPTGALDSKNAKALLETMTQINEEDNMTTLLVTHDPYSASYCKRIIFIKDGEIGHEIKRNNLSRAEFYQQILDSLGTFED